MYQLKMPYLNNISNYENSLKNRLTNGGICLDKLEETILSYRNSRFLVVEPGGNHGDRLIYKGMEKKLKL